MWWDSSEITLVDSVLFSLLTMLFLYLVGFGFLRLLSTVTKRVDVFNSFDLFQKINFRIIFGFIFIFFSVLFFSIFNFSFLVSTLLIIAITIVGFVSRRPNIKLKLPRKFRFKNYSFLILVIVVLLAVVFFSSILINGFYGSTNDDGADHTLMTRIILDNPHALITRSGQPYVSFSLNYPSSTHVLCAFFVTVLGVPIQKIVIMISAILPCLIVLSFYSTLKCLFENKVLSILALIISAFFTIGFSFAPIFWGGLPLLLSLYLSITSMGLIFVFLLKKMTYVHALLIGLVLFITSQTYPIALLIVPLWFVLILSVKLLSKFRNDNNWRVSPQLFFDRKKIVFLIVFLTPILFSIPYFYHVFSFSFVNAQFNSIDAASNLSTEVVKTQIGFNWLFDIPALSHYFSSMGALLALAPCSLFLLIVFCIPSVSQRIASIFPAREFARTLFLIYFFMLLILSYLTLSLYFHMNFLLAIFNPERVLQHMFIPAIILTAVVMFSAIFFSFLAFKRIFQSDKARIVRLSKNKILACLLLILLIFNFGLLSVPIINEQQGAFRKVRSSFATYETLGNDDVLLMNWVLANIPSNADILVSMGDSGQFVEAVTQRQTIFRYSYLQNYSYLMTLLTTNSSDLRAVPIMIQYNVSHVYIGSIPTTYALNLSYYRQFNVTQFLSTPYFSLTKEFGNAWLLQFNASLALDLYKTVG